MADLYLRKSRLHVEGVDDFYVIADLLKASGFQMDKEPRDIQIDKAAKSVEGHGRDGVLSLIKTAVKASTGSAVAFVVDADKSAAATWAVIKRMIEDAVGEAGGNSKLPQVLPADGLVADLDNLKSRVGVWIMPDNSSPGILEDFLRELVHTNDTLIQHALSSTDGATALGAEFPNVARSKAVIHAWLGLAKEAGMPFRDRNQGSLFRRKLRRCNEVRAMGSEVGQLV